VAELRARLRFGQPHREGLGPVSLLR
jgi:hypothetical protein